MTQLSKRWFNFFSFSDSITIRIYLLFYVIGKQKLIHEQQFNLLLHIVTFVCKKYWVVIVLK